MSSITSPLAAKFANATETTTIDGVSTAAVVTNHEQEYASVRERSAISDQSHYSKFQISGSGALDFLNHINLPDIARVPIGKASSSFLLNADGGVFAECYVVAGSNSYLLLVEGRSHADVTAYLNEHVGEFDAKVEDITTAYAMIELDGPFAWEVLKDLMGVKILGLRYLETIENQKLGETAVHIIRAGKTGEFGYTLLVSAEQAVACWDLLMKTGERYQMLAVGTKTLDVCRLENRFPNMRLDCAKVANPFEMNCRVMFDREKDDHLGRSAIEDLLESGPAKRIVGFVANDDSQDVLEIGDAIKLEDNTIGEVVNSGFSYMLGRTIGLALISNEFAYVGLQFAASGSGNPRSIETVSAPFVYNKSLAIRPQEHSFHNPS